MTYVFTPAPQPVVPVSGTAHEFPVHRIYCVGKNYAAHIREMGADPQRQPPCFFMKPPDAVVTDGKVDYPLHTRNYHFEAELVIAIGKAGVNISPESSLDHVFGYAIGLDMTRRDLQQQAISLSQPWDTAKGFDQSAPVSAIYPVSQVGHFERGKIRLFVNEALRQDADLAELIWKNQEIVAQLSSYYELLPGDLIFTGTPAGVGAVNTGDVIRVEIEKLGELLLAVGPDFKRKLTDSASL